MMNLKYDIPVILKGVPDDSHNFKPLPTPTGEYPYRLNIEEVIGKEVEAVRSRMIFQMVGDTGSARHSDFQALVASSLTQQLGANVPRKNNPSFLYHLGDIVYNHGEACEYPAQFLTPYGEYNAPIFAIAGNHDADINPDSTTSYQSLDAFMNVFCDQVRRPIGFGKDSRRLSMIQPHVYWTLETPLARFIGLYANVNRYGIISDEQREWFIEELRYAKEQREEQAIIVCIHHAPYSADTNHGSSLTTIDFLENAFTAAGVRPDMVCSGHVHNYQRFSKSYKDGAKVPYIVAGAGGYADLHTLANTYDKQIEALPLLDHGVRLDAYCDNCYGFLKIEIEKVFDGLNIIGEYYTLPEYFSVSADMEAQLYDRFTIPLKRSAFSTELS